MRQKILLLILFSIFKSGYLMDIPYSIDAIFDEKSFTLVFYSHRSYPTRLIMYQNETTPRYEMAPNYFDCSLVIRGNRRYCTFHSDEPFSRLWGSIHSKICVRDVSSPIEQCYFGISDFYRFPKPTNLKYNKKPRTSGGDIVITGNYLRIRGGPNLLQNTNNPFVIKGNFSDPSFDCNNITVTIPPGSGNFAFAFDEDSWSSRFPFSYESPKILSTVLDSSKQILTIIGDNFFTDKKLVEVSINGINKPNFNITVNHTQITVNNFSIPDPGPMSVYIKVNEISIEKNYIHCFPAIIKSISSVSNHLGGIVTINGEKLSSTLNSSFIPSITIGNKQCTYIKSTTTELECKLEPNENGGTHLTVDVNFGGCNSTSPNGVSLSYNAPTLSSVSYSNGFVTLIGTRFGKNKESFIQLHGNGINGYMNIDQFKISPNEKSLTFKLPLLRCSTFNINFISSNMTSNTISISAPLLINVINRPNLLNGTLNIELFYIDCPISPLLEPSITVGSSSSATQCSMPSLQYPNSSFYVTTCSTPYGTGTNKQFIFQLNSETVSDEFSYAPPIIENRKSYKGQYNITFYGNNFGNSISLIKLYFNGKDISSEIKTLTNNQLTIKTLNSYENGPINITVDGNNMESLFNLKFPPVIYGIINKDNKTIACGGIITVSGKNLLTNEDEFIVKVLVNNKNTTIISQDENILIVRADSTDSPLFVSTYVGDDLGPNVILTFLEPKVTVISTIKNKKDGISITIGGVCFSGIINASLAVSSENVSLSCNSQCSISPKLSSNETDCLLCHSNSFVKETSGVLYLQLGSTPFHYDVKIEETQTSISPSPSPSIGNSSKLSGGQLQVLQLIVLLVFVLSSVV
ncbi:hypothetical protein ACTFIW_002757 [Dictyostelium discoideum]